MDPRIRLVMFLQGDSKEKGNRYEMSTAPCKYFACKQAVGIEKKPTKFQTPASSVLSIIKPANKLAKQRAIAAKVELHQQVLHKAVPRLNLQTL